MSESDIDPTIMKAENTGLSNLTYPSGHFGFEVAFGSTAGIHVDDWIFNNVNSTQPNSSLPAKK